MAYGVELITEGLEPCHDFLHLFADASFFTNLFPMGPLFHACSRVRSGLGLSRAEVGLALALEVVSGAFVRPPLLWSVFGPSSVRFFSSLALSGFARSGLGVLVLVFSPFSFLLLRSPSRVPVKKLSSHIHCHLTFISLSSSAPLLRGVCVCVPSVEM